MNDVLLCNFIEKMRYARKLTQEELVDGVCDLRQYKRYRKGENKIPLKIIIKFSDKLGMNLISLLSSFEDERLQEKVLLNELYNTIANGSLEESEKLMNQIEEEHIIDVENIMYYNHSKNLLKYYDGMIHQKEYLERTMTLIDYPKILQKDALGDVEILILSSLLDFNKEVSSDDVLDKLNSILQEGIDNLGSRNDYMIALVLMRLSKVYGSKGEYDKVLLHCNLGITRCHEIRSFYMLDYYYYYLSLVYFKEEDIENFEYHLYQCFNCIHLSKDTMKIEKFSKLIKNDFGIVYNEFMEKYLSK